MTTYTVLYRKALMGTRGLSELEALKLADAVPLRERAKVQIRRDRDNANMVRVGAILVEANLYLKGMKFLEELQRRPEGVK